MPVRRILKELLEPRQLKMLIETDAIKITCSSKVGEKLNTRIHAAQGLVHVVPQELQQTLPPQPPRGCMMRLLRPAPPPSLHRARQSRCSRR